MATNPDDGQPLAQGDLRLLDTDLARALLTSTVPARFAYIAADDTPRVIATWFHWDGAELVMPTTSPDQGSTDQHNDWQPFAVARRPR